MKKVDLINIMLKKYNCSDIKEVKNINPIFAGSICNGDLKIVFDIENDFLNKKRYLIIENK
jgi:hypothetical protein